MDDHAAAALPFENGATGVVEAGLTDMKPIHAMSLNLPSREPS